MWDEGIDIMMANLAFSECERTRWRALVRWVLGDSP
jgi:hypothetical protein